MRSPLPVILLGIVACGGGARAARPKPASGPVLPLGIEIANAPSAGDNGHDGVHPPPPEEAMKQKFVLVGQLEVGIAPSDPKEAAAAFAADQISPVAPQYAAYCSETVDEAEDTDQTSITFVDGRPARLVEVLKHKDGKPPETEETSITFGAGGLLTKLSSRDPDEPAPEESAFEYDPKARTALRTRTGSPTLLYTFDAAGRLVKKTEGDNVTLEVSYDANGRVTAWTESTNDRVEHTLSYDAQGRPETDEQKGKGWAATRKFVWDANGRLVKIVQGDDAMEIEYDAAGYPSKIVDDLTDTQTTTTYDYGCWK